MPINSVLFRSLCVYVCICFFFIIYMCLGRSRSESVLLQMVYNDESN